MPVYLLSFGLWLHVMFWGSGLAWLTTPRKWQRLWPLFALAAGLTLQSLVVWTGALADLPGTQAYALPSEFCPLVFLGLAIWRSRTKDLVRDLKASLGVLLVSLVVLFVLVVPYAQYYRHHGLTTASLGSCDAADYAGGARALMEFARSDRSGFLGLTEVTRVMSIEHFFDFYLRSMHFTPCAIIALNGSVFQLAPYKIIGVVTALLLASMVPVVFLISRSLVGIRKYPSLAVALLFGFSPINWYAVYHTAMAHLLAAHAIGLLTWGSWSMWKHSAASLSGRTYSGILSVAYALLLGSYSFIVIICLIPAIGFAGGMAFCLRQWKRFSAWWLWTSIPLAVAGLIFSLRVTSIVERFAILKKYDMGWTIPCLWPEGWLGLVKNARLDPLSDTVHGIAGVLLVVAIGLTIYTFRGGRRWLLLRVGCLAVPALLGSFYLYIQGINWGEGANRSYNAYKLICIFYPGILPCLCIWLSLVNRGSLGRVFAYVLSTLVIFGVAKADLKFHAAMKSPAHLVENELIAIQSVESSEDITSINMMIPDMWSRLWANQFLLKKPQYFATHTYEGRMNTPLRGTWDLNGGVFDLNLPQGGSRDINTNYSLANVTSPYFLRLTLADGWHEPERLRRPRTIHWVWSKGDASIHIDNPHTGALKASFHFEIRSATERDLSIWFNHKKVADTSVGVNIKAIDVSDVIIIPGGNEVEIRSQKAAAIPGENDSRHLGFALYRFSVDVAE